MKKVTKIVTFTEDYKKCTQLFMIVVTEAANLEVSIFCNSPCFLPIILIHQLQIP
jgi:hypothetical protein